MRPIDVLTSPWAIIPEKFAEIKEIYSRHLRGEKIDIRAVEAQLGKPLNNEPQGYQVQDGVALLALDGVIAKKMNLFTRISGGVSTQVFARDFRAALADPNVNAIVMIIDSPGGTVDGTQELARIIAEARVQDKPVVSWVDGMMASAAYWVGSAADRVYIGAGTDMIGSIGVAMEHVDYSAYEQKAGIKTTDIYAGKYKRIASSNAPLSEEGKAYLQDQVDAIYTLFVDAVAQHRGASVEQVLKNMADGRIFLGQQAIDNGLVDGASTLDALIADLAAGSYSRKSMTGAGAASAAETETRDAGAASESEIQTNHTGDIPMNREQLQKEHPDLFNALIAEGMEAGLKQGRTEGASAERERIQGVEAAALPGHGDLIARLKFDGKTTPGEAALQVNAAERKKLGKRADDISADAADVSAPAPSAAAAGHIPPPEDKDVDAGKPVEERCKAKWEKDATIRAEFPDLESYTGYVRAQESGRIRVLGAPRRAA